MTSEAMRKLFAPIACALALAACATTPSAHLGQGKALLYATDSLDALATASDTLAKNGVLKGQAAATVAADLGKARAAQSAASAAYAAGQDASAATNAATVTALVTEIATLIAGSK